MSICEKALGGMWGLNLLAICAVNLSEIQHCLSVLILYAATYFLFAPLHVLILMCVWMAYGLERGDSPLSAGAGAGGLTSVLRGNHDVLGAVLGHDARGRASAHEGVGP